MPELMISRLLSLWGTSEKLFIFKCSLLSKNSRNILLNSFTPYGFMCSSSKIYLYYIMDPYQNPVIFGYPGRYSSMTQVCFPVFVL